MSLHRQYTIVLSQRVPSSLEKQNPHTKANVSVFENPDCLW